MTTCLAVAPITIHIVPELRLRHSVWTGTVTDALLIESYERLLHDPTFDPTLHDLIDTTGATRLDVSVSGIWELSRLVARRDVTFTRTRVAIVARMGAPSVLARLYTYYRQAQRGPAEHRAFLSIEQATQWLGVECPSV